MLEWPPRSRVAAVGAPDVRALASALSRPWSERSFPLPSDSPKRRTSPAPSDSAFNISPCVQWHRALLFSAGTVLPGPPHSDRDLPDQLRRRRNGTLSARLRTARAAQPQPDWIPETWCMCGIAGIVSATELPAEDRHRVIAMRDMLVHRGRTRRDCSPIARPHSATAG